jgi:hypothetical protein
MTLSEAQDMLHAWGRWARRSDAPSDSLAPNLYRTMIHSSEDWEGITEAPPVPVDEREAMRTDRILIRLATAHLAVIKRHYVHMEAVDWRERHPAIRAFMDACG